MVEIDLKSDCEYLGELFEYYSTKNSTWGSLHVVLDDGNVDRSNVEFCKKWAIEHNDYLGAFLAEVLLKFSDEQLRLLKEDWAEESMSTVLAWVASGWGA